MPWLRRDASPENRCRSEGDGSSVRSLLRQRSKGRSTVLRIRTARGTERQNDSADYGGYCRSRGRRERLGARVPEDRGSPPARRHHPWPPSRRAVEPSSSSLLSCSKRGHWLSAAVCE